MRKLALSFSSLLAALWISTLLLLPFVGLMDKERPHVELLDFCSGETADILDNSSGNSDSSSLERIYSSPMRNYFYNLRDNFGFNQNGSCGYVGLGMLLTYYDSYFDDKLVAEQYDKRTTMSNFNDYNIVSSPGSNESQINRSDYYNTLLSRSNTSLHANLVRIGNTLNYGLGTTPSILNNVLNRYFENNTQISRDRWEISMITYDNFASLIPNQNITYSTLMYNQIVSYLKMDVPVLVSIRNNSGGHVVVAYDYDSTEDIIYAHYGWHSSNFHANILTNGYQFIRGYIVMGPKDSHTHCNNYIVNGTAKCSCALPNHKHCITYQSQNDSTHIKSCHCGYSVTESHRYTVQGTGANTKYIYCENCGHGKLNNGGIIGPIRPYGNEEDDQ